MYIKKIQLKKFRNYEEIEIEFDKRLNLILGKNAQGKTNLIEGIYVTSMGKSFRTSKDSNMIKFGEENTIIKTDVEKNYYDTSVNVSIGKDSKKIIKKDGVVIKKTSQLLENIMIVIFSPEDLKIVKEEPEKRRKFIDRELCQIKPGYFEALVKYKKALLQRNIYLKEEKVEDDVLDLWDVQLSKYGSEIIKYRKEFIEKISKISFKIHDEITNKKEKLKIIYCPNISYKEDIEEIEKNFYNEIKKSKENDIKQRNTSRGPHKDDFKFMVNDINMRNFGSQGQQRTCALSLKLAELDLIKEETDEDAILLLDDVMSELDLERQKYLIKLLDKNQLFITTTDIEDDIKKSLKNGKIFYIKNGNIMEEKPIKM